MATGGEENDSGGEDDGGEEDEGKDGDKPNFFLDAVIIGTGLSGIEVGVEDGCGADGPETDNIPCPGF